MSAETSQVRAAEFESFLEKIRASLPKDRVDYINFIKAPLLLQAFEANFEELPEEEIDRIRAEFEASLALPGECFMASNRSILDNWKTNYDGAFFGPGREGTVTQMTSPPIAMEIVGNCPACGAPVYGHKVSTEDYPPVRHSCTCRLTLSTSFSTSKEK